MKFPFTPILILPGLMLSSCTNTIFLGHDRAYDLNVGLGADITKVVALNAGIENRSFVAVPPEYSLSPNQLGDPKLMGGGNALSTLSAMKVKRVGQNASEIDYIAATATGDAADEIGKSIEAGKGAAPAVVAANPIAAAAEKITSPDAQ